jgi:hypothetical protein
MPRALSPQAAAEYEELNAFLRFYLAVCKGADISLFEKSAAEIEEKYGRGRALLGLRQAVNDTIEELAGANSEAIELLDTSLAERGLVSFSELRRRYSAKYKALLKRGHIRNDTEFYLVSGVASDLSAKVSEEERSQLQRMIEAYERDA